MTHADPVSPRRCQLAAIALVLVVSLVLVSCKRGSDDLKFDTISFTVIPAGATTPASRWCAYLADTQPLREHGLMNTKDLDGKVGMIFRFDSDTTASFHMKDTPMPLSIAWFDADGRYVSQTDMEPCLDKKECPLYGAKKPYRTAIEVPVGELVRLSIGDGATLRVGGDCPVPVGGAR